MPERLTRDDQSLMEAAALLVREWHAADCQLGETAAEVLAAKYPAEPEAAERWAAVMVELVEHPDLTDRERQVYWDARWLARAIAYRDGAMPAALAAFVRDVRSRKRQPPRAAGRPDVTTARNARIVVYAHRLAAWGFNLTGDDALGSKPTDDRGSAADVIAVALGMSYKTVANIVTSRDGRATARLLSHSRKPANNRE